MKCDHHEVDLIPGYAINPKYDSRCIYITERRNLKAEDIEIIFVAKCPKCGDLVMVSADLPETRDDNAREIAACIRQGYIIERTTAGWVHTAPWKFCKCNGSPWDEPEATQTRMDFDTK